MNIYLPDSAFRELRRDTSSPPALPGAPVVANNPYFAPKAEQRRIRDAYRQQHGRRGIGGISSALDRHDGRLH